jgi:hypothetical protein
MEEQEEKTELLDFYVAGLRFYKYSEVKNLITVGSKIDLVPEPENQYDPNAVQLHFQGMMIGFVPKKHSAYVSAIFEVGGIHCVVKEINPQEKPYLQLNCSILED